MSPTLPRSAILIRTEDHKKEVGKEKHIKYLERNRPVSTMTYQQTSDQMITDRKVNLAEFDMNSVFLFLF